MSTEIKTANSVEEPKKQMNPPRQRILGLEPEEKSITEEILELEPQKKPHFNVNPLFHLVEDILHRAIRNVTSNVMDIQAYMKEAAHQDEVIYLRERFNHKLDKISYEIAYNTSSKGESHGTVLSIFKILNEYSWEARLILTLTAFALNYGECWHLALIYSSRQLAESMSILKQVADIHRQPDLLSPPLKVVNDLVMAIMSVTRCIIDIQMVKDQLSQLDKSYESSKPYSEHSKVIPITVYWTIRSVLVCASNITRLISMNLKYVISSIEKDELETLKNKLYEKLQILQSWRQDSLNSSLEEARINQFLNEIKSLMEVPQVDNMNILKALFHYKDDQAPLMWDQKQVDLEALRKKLVLLLISDLDISEEDISIVEDIYSNSRAKRTQQSRLEIVWLPIIDKSEDWESEKTKEKFMKKQRAMKWHTVHRPSLIAKEVIKLAKEEWHFEKKRIIVVIDAQGQVACPDAFPMIYVWGYETYPFSTSAQESQWKETPGLLELLMAPFYPEIQDSIESGQHCICLCGGEDMEWIKMFTTRAPSVASAADVVLEMIYLGKWKPNKQRQRRNTATIEREDLKLKYSLTEEKQMKFWKRLENMGHSRMQLGKRIYEDLIMQDIISLLNMGSSRGGWAVICRGSDFRIKAKGKHILDSLVNFCEWKDNIRRQDFLGALEHYLTMNPGHVDVYKHIKSYERIINIFERTQKVHCLEILKALVSARDYWQPLVYGKTKQRVTIDLLKRKKLLLLLISDCNISEKEINRLATIYEETECEIVWLPIVVAFAQKEFQYKQEKMPWYSVYHPSVINEAAIKFIREVWRYEEKTILVALDQQGRVVTPNALHLIWIWGKGAIPSTISKEEATTSREVVLWKGLSWSLDLITNDLDPIIQRWKQEDNLICLYGGEDIKWIRNFTRTAKQVAKSAAIGVQMLYVGMSNLNKRCSSNIVKITEEELSHCWKERVLIWSFWSRLQSIWHTGYQIGKSMKDDPIMKELTTLLSFDSRECGWALMSKGSGPGALVTAKGSDILECLLKYEEEWKEQALKNGFLPTLKEKLVDYHKLDKCFQLVLPEFATTNLETAECSHCRGTVEKLTFQCCGHV